MRCELSDYTGTTGEFFTAIDISRHIDHAIGCFLLHPNGNYNSRNGSCSVKIKHRFSSSKKEIL